MALDSFTLNQQIDNLIELATSQVILSRLNSFIEQSGSGDINIRRALAAREFSLDSITNDLQSNGFSVPNDLRISSRVFETSGPIPSLANFEGNISTAVPTDAKFSINHDVQFSSTSLTGDQMAEVRSSYNSQATVDFLIGVAPDNVEAKGICVCIGTVPACVGIGG